MASSPCPRRLAVTSGRLTGQGRDIDPHRVRGYAPARADLDRYEPPSADQFVHLRPADTEQLGSLFRRQEHFSITDSSSVEAAPSWQACWLTRCGTAVSPFPAPSDC